VEVDAETGIVKVERYAAVEHCGALRGVGEGGMIIAPPTVVNAIEDALSPFGVRIYEQHLPPARILELIAAATRASKYSP
jgi:CO/xanthine dehydrogenase Mo-binding subunit